MNPAGRGTFTARRGGMLLEVLISIAIFVAVALFALGAVRNTLAAFDREALRLKAIDLARSKLAELEAGLTSIADVRGQGVTAIGSVELDASDPDTSVWDFEVRTMPTEFTGLTLVELTVRRSSIDSSAVDESPVGVTLRQFMKLRDVDVEASVEDDLLRALPEAQP